MADEIVRCERRVIPRRVVEQVGKRYERERVVQVDEEGASGDEPVSVQVRLDG